MTNTATHGARDFAVWNRREDAPRPWIVAAGSCRALIWLVIALALVSSSRANCNPNGVLVGVKSLTVAEVRNPGDAANAVTVDENTPYKELFVCEKSGGNAQITNSVADPKPNLNYIGWRIETALALDSPLAGDASPNEDNFALNCSSPPHSPKNVSTLTPGIREYYVKIFCDGNHNCTKDCSEGCSGGCASCEPYLLQGNKPKLIVKVTLVNVDLDVGNGSGGGPDGDVDDPEDGTHGYIPGNRGNANVLSWSSGILSPQPLKIVALAPGVASVRFELVSYTTLEGFCANSYQPDATSYDYSFDSSTDTWIAHEPAVGGKAVVDFYCKDFGGKCRVEVTFRDAANNVLHTCWLDIPRDADSDGISDQWEENAVTEWNAQYGESQTVGNGFFAASDDKEKTDPDGAGSLAAHTTVGDSLTVMQEYRGFMFDGPADWGGTVGYKRLSPARKNLLIEVENMGGFTGSATKAEVVSAMATLKTVYLSSTGAEVDYATDNNNAPYANFSSESAVTTYRTTHRGHDASTFDYSEYLYLLFCEKDWTADTYGRGGGGWLGANVYCTTGRARAASLSSLGLGITFSGCIGYTATHEIGHCLKAEHHLPVLSALQVNYSPLAAGETVLILRDDNDLKLETAPDAATYHTISLLAATADTFTELDGQVDGLAQYSASVLGSSGAKYSYTIYGSFWWVDPTADAVIKRHYDHSVMESPAHLLDQLLSPTFANTGTGYAHEVQKMDFANKE